MPPVRFDRPGAYCVLSLFLVAYIPIQILRKTGATADSRTVHLIMEIIVLMLNLNALFWM